MVSQNEFELRHKNIKENVECKNYKSATSLENRDKVEAQIIEELKMGNYVITDSKPKIVSAMGQFRKKIVRKLELFTMLPVRREKT